MKINNVPILRFKFFNDGWKRKKLGDNINYVKGNNGDINNVPILTISASNGWMNQKDRFGSILAGNELKKYTMLSKNQLSYNHGNSKIAEYGVVFMLKNYDKALVPKVYHSFEVTDDNYPLFIQNLFLSKKPDRQLRRVITSGARKDGLLNINEKSFSSINVNLPSLNEQKYIVKFFSKIDDIINLHLQKLNQLKKLKRGYLQKMFPQKGKVLPRLRFSEFNDSWHSVKLGELIVHNNIRNKDLSITNVESVSNKKGFLKQTDQFEDYSVASKDLSNYIVIKPGMFAYNPSRINVGSIAYKDYNSMTSVVSPLYVSFQTKEKLDDDFLLYWFKTEQFRYQRERYSEGGVRDSLSFKLLTSLEFLLPSLQEQKKISTFLSKIDYLIEQQNEKIKSVKDVKKYYLQRMFI